MEKMRVSYGLALVAAVDKSPKPGGAQRHPSPAIATSVRPESKGLDWRTTAANTATSQAKLSQTETLAAAADSCDGLQRVRASTQNRNR